MRKKYTISSKKVKWRHGKVKIESKGYYFNPLITNKKAAKVWI